MDAKYIKFWAPPTTTLLNGLLFYTKLDESSGNAFDEVESYEGTASNITYTESGKIGRCFTFNGSNTQVNFGNIIGPTTGISISLWVKTSGLSASGAIIDKTEYDLNWYGYRIWVYDDGEAELFFGDGLGNNLGKTIAANIADNAWHHIVITWNGTTAYTYYDNSQSASSAWSGPLDYIGNDLGIGANAEYGNLRFNGSIDEVGIWNRELTSTEVAELYNSDSGKTYPFS